MNRILKFFLPLLLVLSLSACSKESGDVSGKFKAGTYTATVDGYNAPLTVKVVLSNSTIKSVTITDHKESVGIADIAIKNIPTAIVDEQSLAVDTISGSTTSSKAIIAAVVAAIKKSGADIDKLMIKSDNKVAEADITETVDVVIIGSGGAGLSAAIEASKAGASVIVLEQMPKAGGNTLISGSGYNAVDPKRQGAMGIEDSTDLFFDQTMESGDSKNDPELVRILVDGAYDGVEFLESFGMEWQDEISTAPGGLYQRRHMPANGALGVPMINALLKGAEEGNVRIMLNTKATEIVMDNNKVVGVIAEGKTGNKITLNVNKGVVIATGGFSANVEMREQYNTIWPTLDKNVLTTNHPGADGSGIELATNIGADLVDMEYIQLFPYGNPKNGSMTGSIMKQPENAIYLNSEGLRFVDEYGRRDVVSSAILAQTDSLMFVIVDGKTYVDDNAPTDFGTTIGEEVASSRSVKGNTIEELAVAMNMDPKIVKKEVDKYNAGVDAKNDVFGKTPMNKIDTAPYYGSPRTPTVHHTMGGIKINSDTQVLNKDGEVINGLYAAGEVVGGVHGSNRVGANALSEIIVFGRIAGKNVVTQ